uniref:Uncharacterized protein n=1 Tax=Romanomermis culicivorax TaxID=13658 RepID=A0A915IT29_ROMCU
MVEYELFVEKRQAIDAQRVCNLQFKKALPLTSFIMASDSFFSNNLKPAVAITAAGVSCHNFFGIKICAFFNNGSKSAEI